MAYKFETRAISARIYTEPREKCERLGVSVNKAANYGLEIFVKALQRGTIEQELSFHRDFFTYKTWTRIPAKATSLRIRHDFLDYIEMQGLNRNKLINTSIEYVCEQIQNGSLSINALNDGPNGYGIARKNVYTKHVDEAEGGQDL